MTLTALVSSSYINFAMHFRKELGLHFVYDMPELLPTFLPYLSWSIEHHSIIFPRKAHIKSAQLNISHNFTIMRKTLQVWDQRPCNRDEQNSNKGGDQLIGQQLN